MTEKDPLDEPKDPSGELVVKDKEYFSSKINALLKELGEAECPFFFVMSDPIKKWGCNGVFIANEKKDQESSKQDFIYKVSNLLISIDRNLKELTGGQCKIVINKKDQESRIIIP